VAAVVSRPLIYLVEIQMKLSRVLMIAAAPLALSAAALSAQPMTDAELDGMTAGASALSGSFALGLGKYSSVASTNNTTTAHPGSAGGAAGAAAAGAGNGQAVSGGAVQTSPGYRASGGSTVTSSGHGITNSVSAHVATTVAKPGPIPRYTGHH
jgi:hypothetical protein